MWYHRFSVFCRADANYRLKDLVRMVRIESVAAECTRAPLNMDDDLVVRGRRILSLAALLEDWLWPTGADITYAHNNVFVRTLPADLPGSNALRPRGRDGAVWCGTARLAYFPPISTQTQQTHDTDV